MHCKRSVNLRCSSINFNLHWKHNWCINKSLCRGAAYSSFYVRPAAHGGATVDSATQSA
ncbi:unnamed protein product [Ixodes persulcatus]